MKKCSKCLKEKPLSEFHKRNNRDSGVTSRCKECLYTIGMENYVNKHKPFEILDGEQWVDIKGYEGRYKISSYGRVMSLAIVFNRAGIEVQNIDFIKKQSTCNKKAYPVINLGGKIKTVHRLLAEHFIPNPEKKQTVNHKDGKKNNNSLDNLEWATYSENNQHARNMGLNKGRRKIA